MIRIALIGADGQLGSDIVKVFDKARWKILSLTHRDIEIKDKQSIEKKIDPTNTDIIINTAAFHQTDICEDRPDEALAVNALGARNLSFWCRKYHKILVHFSTDYVFGRDVKRAKPYSELDPVGPINAYGVSKMAGEFFVGFMLKRFFLIRTSGLFGVAGSSGKGGNFVETMIKKAKNGKSALRVVNDQILSPTYTKNLAENLETLLVTKKFGLYHMASHGQCSWFQMAKQIFSYLRMDILLEPISSAETGAKATRPAYSALLNTNLQNLGIDRMNSWQDNLRLYLIEKGYLR